MKKIIKGIRNHRQFTTKYFSTQHGIQCDKILIERQFLCAWETPEGEVVIERYYKGAGIEMDTSNIQEILTGEDADNFKNGINFIPQFNTKGEY